MKKLVYIILGTLTLLSSANASFGQNRTLGARSIVLDDGSGNTVLLQTAGGATGTFTLPNGGGTLATQGFFSGLYLPLTGGSMSGAIDMGANNINNIGQLNLVAATAGGAGSIVVNGTTAISLYSSAGTGQSVAISGAGNTTGTGFLNVSIGMQAAHSFTSGGENIAIGASALSANTSGFHNTAIGVNAIGFSNPGSQNTAIGEYALTSLNNVGVNGNNTGVGFQAGNYNTTGVNNTYLGANSGSGGTNTTGSGNTIIGANAGQLGGANTSYANVTLLGNGANMGANNLTNATAIGNGATVSASNTIQLGNASVTAVNTAGNLNAGGTATVNGVSVGSVFSLNSSGNITKLNNVTTNFPAAQGAASTVLTNDGSGNLSWQSSVGFSPAYLNAYTNSAFATVAPGAIVPVTTVSANSGFTPNGSGGFAATSAGVYNVEYTVARVEAGGFALSVNGIVVTSSKFSCATGTSVIHGNAILTLNAGDLLKLVASPDNSTAMTLEVTPGVPFAVQASMTAVQIH